MPKIKYAIFFSIFFLLIGLTTHSVVAQKLSYSSSKNAVGSQAMVVSPHPLASEVGLSILQAGGNAVDATIAVQFAQAVVYPRAGNIGGGGFMVIRMQNGETATIDYREKAPRKADRNMYLDAAGNIIPGLSTKGHLAAGVPGTVDGLIQAHEKFGKLPFPQLIQPAIELAENGYPISQTEATRLNRFQPDFKAVNDDPNPFIRENWKEGDMLVQVKLANTLRRIQQKGRAGFYKGKVAKAIVKEMKEGNGIISRKDLAKYRAQWRAAVTGQYKDYKIISMPPPSSGGIALVQLLKMVEDYPIEDWGFHDPRTIHLMVEAERRAYADRSQHLGDMDFYPVPIDSMLSKKYVEGRMANFSPEKASLSSDILAGAFQGQIKESFETTHSSIVDKDGNAVSLTTTLNSNFGCKVWVDEAGFFLNNEMDDFSSKPGVPNQFGLVGAEANAIYPGKRMLSSMTPTIIEKDGELFMVIGAPGGSTIITAVFQVFLNVAAFDMDLPAAVDASRFHHQWLPDRILIEKNGMNEELKEQLKALGHQLYEVNYMAVIKAIHKLQDGSLKGVGDRRNPDDDARGY
ncbi:MAG: gamma-glutamyltransferase [Saprospiraceae bacterium]|nr:gamma-glutamyltransferase [Saprospiraceae bacterium]